MRRLRLPGSPALLLLVLAAWGLAGGGLRAAPAGDVGCRLEPVADLPFRVNGERIVVRATIAARPVSLVFDTGAFTTILTESAARRLGLARIAESVGEAHGLGGARPLGLVSAPSFTLGALHGSGLEFNTATLPWLDAIGADGLLSTDILSRYDIDFDLPGKRIVLYAPRGDCARPRSLLGGRLVRLPLLPARADGIPRVRVEVNGEQVIAALDTGSPYTAILAHAVPRLNLDIDRPSYSVVETARGFGPDPVYGVAHASIALGLGALRLSGVKISVYNAALADDIDMLLGLDLQSVVHVWLSNSSGTLILQLPPAPTPVASRENAVPELD